MYVCFSQLEEEEAKKRKRKNQRDKIVDKMKVKCPRASHGAVDVAYTYILNFGTRSRYAVRFTSRPL